MWVLFAGAGIVLYQTSETWAAEEEPVTHDSGQVDAVKYLGFVMFGESHSRAYISQHVQSWSRDGAMPFSADPRYSAVKIACQLPRSRSAVVRLTHCCGTGPSLVRASHYSGTGTPPCHHAQRLSTVQR